MAKKKEPDKLDKLITELTKDATAEELLKDSGLLKELIQCQVGVGPSYPFDRGRFAQAGRNYLRAPERAERFQYLPDG